MKESLEDFIRRNRPAFDSGTPREGLWDRIDPALTYSGWWHSLVLWRAAAVLLLGVSILLYTVPVRPGDRSAAIRSEFDDLENFYNLQISEKVSLISSLDVASADDDYTMDLKRLDAMYDVLRQEMLRRPSVEVRDALILNLLVKIDLLNRRIKDIEEVRSGPIQEI